MSASTASTMKPEMHIEEERSLFMTDFPISYFIYLAKKKSIKYLQKLQYHAKSISTN